MTNYENDIMNLLKGETPKQKYEYLKTLKEISMPEDKTIEDWWGCGDDKTNPNFWKDAPYRTNGDVIEEIKDAVKYFITKWQ